MWNGVTPMELEEIPDTDPMDMASVHELGHGVVAEETGLTVVQYQLWRTKTSLGVEGFTEISRAPNLEMPEEILANILCCLAGQEAAAKFYMLQLGLSLGEALSKAAEGSSTDLSDFQKFRKYYEITEAAARRETRRLINAHWSRIVAGARKLKTRGRLKASAV